MSLTSKKAVNPAKKFIEYKSSKGFYYYDKEKKEQVSLTDTLYVMPLDRLSTITGYHRQSKSGIFSNEIHSSEHEEFVVKAFKGGDIAKGLYKNIKGDLKGGKFTISLYCALIGGVKPNNTVELVNIKFSGGALKPVIDAKLPIEGEIVAICVDPTIVNGDLGDYYIPKVEILEQKPSDRVLAEAESLDRELQEYLTQYKKPVASNHDEVDDMMGTEADIY